MSSGATANYSFPYPLPSDPVRVSGDIEDLAVAVDSHLTTITDVDFNNKTSSYTLSLTDSGRMIDASSSSSIVITVPTNSSVPFPVGTKIDILRSGTGDVSVSAETGVAINSESGKLKVNAQWQVATLIKYGTDVWVLHGFLKS